MKKIFVLFGILCLIGLASAAIYQAPWIQNQLGDLHNLTNMDWISAENINGTNVNGTFVGEVNWTYLANYPSACPGSGAITTLGDSVTCSDLWLDTSGDNLTGNLNAGLNNITNITEVSSTLIDTTNLEADNLESNLDGTGYNITGAWFFGYLNWSNIQNKFISAVNGTYIHMVGTTATLNETKLNLSIRVIDTSTNTSMKGYVDGTFALNTTAATQALVSEGNITLQDKITFRLGEIIDNIVNGWIRITGNLQVDGDVNMTGNFTGNQIYGGMWYHNHTATAIAFDVDGYFYYLFMQNATHLNGFTANNLGLGLNSSLTTNVAGLYKASYMASGDGENNEVYYTSLFINEENQDNCEHHKKLTAGGDILTQTGTCLIDLVVGENVSLRTANVGATGNGNYYSANLNIVRIGD